MAKTAYNGYRDLCRYGSAPHSGFGLGFERTISDVTGTSNVRDVIPFPRTPAARIFKLPGSFRAATGSLS